MAAKRYVVLRVSAKLWDGAVWIVRERGVIGWSVPCASRAEARRLAAQLEIEASEKTS